MRGVYISATVEDEDFWEENGTKDYHFDNKVGKIDTVAMIVLTSKGSSMLIYGDNFDSGKG